MGSIGHPLHTSTQHQQVGPTIVHKHDKKHCRPSSSASIPSHSCKPCVLHIPPPSWSTRASTRPRCPPAPGHLDHYHLFTTVAEEHRQPPEHTYHTAGGTDVDLAIQDEECMAHLCHFVMVHTATSLHLAQIGQPTKKQYSLKAGLKRFGSCGDSAVTKELSQLHTLNCFRPCGPHTLTHDDRRNALTSFMFLTEKRTGEVKAHACANGSVQQQHVAKEEAAKAQSMRMKTATWRLVTFPVPSYKPTTQISF